MVLKQKLNIKSCFYKRIHQRKSKPRRFNSNSWIFCILPWLMKQFFKFGESCGHQCIHNLTVVNLKRGCTSQCAVTLYCTALLLLSPPLCLLHTQQMGNLGRNVTEHCSTISTLDLWEGRRSHLCLYLKRTGGSGAYAPWWPDVGCAYDCRRSWQQMAASPQSPPDTETAWTTPGPPEGIHRNTPPTARGHFDECSKTCVSYEGHTVEF